MINENDSFPAVKSNRNQSLPQKYTAVSTSVILSKNNINRLINRPNEVRNKVNQTIIHNDQELVKVEFRRKAHN